GGVEPDLSYYFANAPRIRGKKNINLRRDPPPDLTIEVVHSRDANRAVEVYRRLGVPEVWGWEHPRLLILHLDKNARYARSSTSLAFPFLSAPEISEWIARPENENETDTDWALQCRQWVRDILRPRTTNPQQAP
ncbi:MAG TPA: Uma2 family endonuclease, partial [Isosphaeraceae bacterium]|nr:Uma2 family endonuclease [Isosphaeraceae bacterium]